MARSVPEPRRRVIARVPDEYTVLLATTGIMSFNDYLYPKLPYEPVGSTPEAFAALAKAERAKWIPLFRKIGIQPQ